MNHLKRLLALLLIGLFFVVANGCQGEAEEQRRIAELARAQADSLATVAAAALDSAHVARQLAEAAADSLAQALADCQAGQ